MTATAASATSIENLTLNITQEVHVRASLEVTFAALLEQIGPQNETPEGVPLPMKIEPWPGGRWYRDRGDNNGHFWANVQAIKRPTLLEFSGPLFASSPLVSNVQYRLSEKDGGTLITFRHTGFGLLEEHHRAGVHRGWASMLERIRKAAELPLAQSAGKQRLQ
jgi:Activator of Hsp90 ATPase homolog 1-like protein